ncbi:hypothetical protein PAMP_024836 [Pampus punctatissimus]
MRPDLRHRREECDGLTLSECPTSPFPLTPSTQQQPPGFCVSHCVPNNLLTVCKYVLDMAGMSYADAPVVGDKFESKEMSGWRQLWATISPDVCRY